jgi:predicted ATPase
MLLKTPMAVLTGGTGGGKSSVLEAIRISLASKGVLTIPEIAKKLFEVGFPVPGSDLDWSQEWQNSFEKANFAAQIAFETAYQLMAEERQARLIVCDRGLLDCAAYLSGVDELCGTFCLTEREICQRYSIVFHLESLAVINPSQYDVVRATDNEHWLPLEEAVALESRTKEVWKNHPNRVVVDGLRGIDHMAASILRELETYL